LAIHQSESPQHLDRSIPKDADLLIALRRFLANWDSSSSIIFRELVRRILEQRPDCLNASSGALGCMSSYDRLRLHDGLRLSDLALLRSILDRLPRQMTLRERRPAEFRDQFIAAQLREIRHVKGR
jgi:hypothetical protein